MLDGYGVICFVLGVLFTVFAPWSTLFYYVLAFIGVADLLIFSMVLCYLFGKVDRHRLRAYYCISFVYDYQ